MIEVRMARCTGDTNLARAIEERLNEGWELAQVIFVGMAEVQAGLDIRQASKVVPMFLAIFKRSVIDA